MTYSIAKEFTKTPGGRFRQNGPFSGEEFRDDVLRDLFRGAVEAGDTLVIVLDGTSGYPPSFLEEAFGGMIRLGFSSLDQMNQHLELKAHDPHYEVYRLTAIDFMESARPLR